MEKIAFLSFMDYANVLTEYSNVINKYSDKYKSKVICLSPHPFGYDLKHDIDINNDGVKKAKEWVDECTHIIFGEEMGIGKYETLTKHVKLLGLNLNDKKVSVWHPGSNYRKGVKVFNENPFTQTLHKRIYALDLYRHSPKTDKDVVLLPFKNFDIDFDEYMDNARKKIKEGIKIISHCPSNAQRKGSDIIQKAINGINLDKSKFKYSFMTEQPNSVVMKLKRNSTFYIDQFNHNASFGVATIESIISGNIVMCRIENAKEGLAKFNSNVKLPIIHTGENLDTLKSTINSVINQDDETLEQMFKDNLTYLKENYYGPNVVKYFEKHILDE
jgi:hypothetical protein